ncbi:uncharacterized protein BO97DRAFT_459098 [Aspergillus homomorphus CBS 101889]|uniref:Uncharacterized protein n=1 Tax=Aspergillus homomorphus (strain CBS 101889) TaxID=1450537 RepID=A0A395I7D6_ASPHC|nr:hypothetical protein BO97DRAFT_459098 [Aspergillus homomorphus CBS 101889]RAL16041.1 hypothetical protein BO97DRAFT_459098 [Aspergillus homomorphus CBS 101889]
MPMQWTSEADAKLFVGVLNQCSGQMKLDTKQLAQYMGADCTPCAVEQRMVKLKKQAKGLTITTTPSPAKKKTGIAEDVAAETPTKGKRKAGAEAGGEGGAKKSSKKNKKVKGFPVDGDDDQGDGEEEVVFKLEKGKGGDGVKKEGFLGFKAEA